MSDIFKIRELETCDLKVLTDKNSSWDLKEKDENWLRWATQFRPLDSLFMVATLNDAVVGYYGTITVPLKIGNNIIPSYRGGMFVHPDHRKSTHAIFSQLVRALHNKVSERQGIVYGFPVQRLVKYYYRKMSFSILKPIPNYIINLRVSELLERYSRSMRSTHIFEKITNIYQKFRFFKIKLLCKKISIRQVHHFDDRFNQLWEEASKAHNAISMRNAEYLNWRYLNEPGESYTIFAAEEGNTILGYIVLKDSYKNNNRVGVIIDLFDIRVEEVTQALLLKTIDYFCRKNTHKISLCLSNNYYENILKKMGFAKESDKPSPLLIVKSYSPNTTDTILKNHDNWFIMTTDLIIA